MAHESRRRLAVKQLASLVKPGGTVVDVKACLDAEGLRDAGLKVWRL